MPRVRMTYLNSEVECPDEEEWKRDIRRTFERLRRARDKTCNPKKGVLCDVHHSPDEGVNDTTLHAQTEDQGEWEL